MESTTVVQLTRVLRNHDNGAITLNDCKNQLLIVLDEQNDDEVLSVVLLAISQYYHQQNKTV